MPSRVVCSILFSVRRPHLFTVAASFLVLTAAAAAGAQSVDLYAPAGPAVAPQRAAPPPLRLAESGSVAPLAELAPAAEAAAERLAAVREWNRTGHLPARIGIVRPLPLAPRVRFVEPGGALPSVSGSHSAVHGTLAGQPDGRRVWGGEVRVEDAHRLRLHLTDVHLPSGTRMWVYGEGGAPQGPFGLDLVHEGELWTPSVAGPVIRLEAELPADAAPDDAGFRIAAVGQVLHPATAWPRSGVATAALDTSCLIDVQCIDSETFPVVDLVESAVAHLQFPVEGGIFVCTGALLNDTAGSGTPYLLTANHCLSDQATASGLEAFWDLKSESCAGSVPNTFPQTTGGTLLATSAISDYTLVELNAIPANRVFLGWNANANAVQHGTELHRVHHPFPEETLFAQIYSRQEHLATGFLMCGSEGGVDVDDPNLFHHGRLLASGTFGGSSGSPLMLSNGQVVGQLKGACGFNTEEGCDHSNNEEVDGAFSASFPALEPYLGSGTGGGDVCVPDATTLCLNGDRFRVQVGFRTKEEQVGDGQVVQVTPVPDSSGLFYFFNRNNWEMLVKVLNGCPVTGHYWVFFAATTNVEFTLTVTDTEHDEVEQYFNPLGQQANAVTDTMAFATCP